MRISIILPAKNEANGLRQTLPGLKAAYPEAEVIVVDDGSTDDTAAVAADHGVRVLSSPYSMGNGAAIKRGARAASGEILVFMDADGQHNAGDIAKLLERLEAGYDMAVGARDAGGQANVGRGAANALYNRLASWMTGHRIADLTSGFVISYRSRIGRRSFVASAVRMARPVPSRRSARPSRASIARGRRPCSTMRASRASRSIRLPRRST